MVFTGDATSNTSYETKEIPYFWAVHDNIGIDPYRCKIPAISVRSFEEAARTLDGQVPAQIEVIIQKEQEDPNNTNLPDPTFLIERQYLHFRLRGAGEQQYTLETRIIDTYLTAKLSRDIHIDLMSPNTPTLLRIKQGVIDSTLKPSDENFQVKADMVLVDRLEALSAALGCDMSDMTVHIFERGKDPILFSIDEEARARIKRAANNIGYEPTKHIPEQIVDYSNI